MILDGLLLFTGTSNGASGGITASTNTDAPTTGTQVASNILDLGVASGVPSSANGAGARDIGVGGEPPLKLLAQVTTAFASGTSLQLVLSGAPDNGSGAPGSYTTMWTSAAYAEADLDVGAQLANVNVPRVIPGQVLPRYLRLQFVTVGTHTAGAICSSITLDRFAQVQGTDSALSGYPAGLNVQN